MPDQKGRFSAQETAFIQRFAATGDAAYAGREAGYSRPLRGAQRVLERPDAHAEIARLQVERLYSEALPAAVDCLVSIIRNERAPAGARVQAAKVVMDRTLGSDDAANGKQPHEMSGDELARAIDALERLASDRAKPVNAEPEADVFG